MRSTQTVLLTGSLVSGLALACSATVVAVPMVAPGALATPSGLDEIRRSTPGYSARLEPR